MLSKLRNYVSVCLCVSKRSVTCLRGRLQQTAARHIFSLLLLTQNMRTIENILIKQRNPAVNTLESFFTISEGCRRYFFNPVMQEILKRLCQLFFFFLQRTDDYYDKRGDTCTGVPTTVVRIIKSVNLIACIQIRYILIF